MQGDRPQIIYISYDGAAEPLGQSQVVAYLERLAADCDIHLVSFEKPGGDRDAVARRLAAAGVEWHPLTYHRRPPVLSTAWDVRRGMRAVSGLAEQIPGPLIVHARSYVPALIATGAKLGSRARFLFDIRGFWPDERVDSGLMRRGGIVYRVAKCYERRFFQHADAVVTLTEASVPQIREWMGPSEAPVSVIPTCVDLDRFNLRPRGDRGPRAIWAGTVGPRYDFRAGVELARVLKLSLRVLTREVEEARTTVGNTDVEVSSLPPAEIPVQLAAGDLGLATMLPAFSRLASAPTRVGEYLAAGMPVAALAGVGDLDRLLPAERVGVAMADSSPESIRRAAREIQPLLADPETPERCRRVAERRFSLAQGVDDYLRIYKGLAGPRQRRVYDPVSAQDRS